MMDLDAYFERIGYTGERSAILDTLRAIVRLHTQAIPFENLNPFLRWPVRLDAASLEQKLVAGGRGGYCFEHNLLLKEVLERLGFGVRGLAARVRWNVPEDVVTPRGHMLLLVGVSEVPYVVDVGFGGQTLTGPLRLDTEGEQATPHEPFRLIQSGEAFTLQARIRDDWKSLYRFDLQEQHLADYEVSNWYLSNHPASHFVTGLIAARTDAGRRYALHGKEFVVHELGGASERRTLTSPSELRAVLTEHFRIVLPDVPELDVALGRLVAPEAVAA